VKRAVLKLLMSMLLVCAGAGARAEDAAPPKVYCSAGFSQPARLSEGEQEGNPVYILKIGNETEILEWGGSVGTGLPGMVVASSRGGEAEVVYTVDLEEAVDPAKPTTIHLILFRDRVFWPCRD